VTGKNCALEERGGGLKEWLPLKRTVLEDGSFMGSDYVNHTLENVRS